MLYVMKKTISMKKTIFYAATFVALCLSLKLNGGTVFKSGENTAFYFSSSAEICNEETPSEEEKLFGIYFVSKSSTIYLS